MSASPPPDGWDGYEKGATGAGAGLLSPAAGGEVPEEEQGGILARHMEWGDGVVRIAEIEVTDHESNVHKIRVEHPTSKRKGAAPAWEHVHAPSNEPVREEYEDEEEWEEATEDHAKAGAEARQLARNLKTCGPVVAGNDGLVRAPLSPFLSSICVGARRAPDRPQALTLSRPMQ